MNYPSSFERLGPFEDLGPGTCDSLIALQGRRLEPFLSKAFSRVWGWHAPAFVGGGAGAAYTVDSLGPDAYSPNSVAERVPSLL